MGTPHGDGANHLPFDLLPVDLLAGVATSAEQGIRFSLPFLNGSILQGGSHTGGRFALLEMRLMPGRGPDPHVHITEDEYFYVLDGEYRFRLGDATVEAGPGQLIKVERGVPHGMVAGDTGGRHLTIFVPAGPEGWFVEANELANSGELDQDALGALFDRYGMVQVDPSRTGMFT